VQITDSKASIKKYHGLSHWIIILHV